MKYRNRLRIEICGLLFAVSMFGGTIGYAAGQHGLVCPTQDSCGAPQYHDHGWYIDGKRVTQ